MHLSKCTFPDRKKNLSKIFEFSSFLDLLIFPLYRKKFVLLKPPTTDPPSPANPVLYNDSIF